MRKLKIRELLNIIESLDMDLDVDTVEFSRAGENGRPVCFAYKTVKAVDDEEYTGVLLLTTEELK